MDNEQLIGILGNLEPVQLKGVEMLRHLRSTTGAWFPNALGSGLVEKAQVVEATVEIIHYVGACKGMIEQLRPLTPVPLSVPLVEYPL